MLPAVGAVMKWFTPWGHGSLGEPGVEEAALQCMVPSLQPRPLWNFLINSQGVQTRKGQKIKVPSHACSSVRKSPADLVASVYQVLRTGAGGLLFLSAAQCGKFHVFVLIAGQIQKQSNHLTALQQKMGDGLFVLSIAVEQSLQNSAA